MRFDFDTPLNRRGGDSSKWRKYPGDVLPMWVADMDFAVAPAITAALQQRIAHPVFGYGLACDSLREIIVTDLAQRYGWAIAPDDIVFLPGVEPGFNMALKAFLSPGDGVLVPTPVYRPMHAAPAHWGLARIDLPLVPDAHGVWRSDPVQLDAALTASRAVLLCNPHNPVGKVYTRDELQELADGCLARDVLIISDEIHSDLVLDARQHIPIASLSREVAARTITLMAASKTYNIAGLKTAFAIVQNPKLRERFIASRLGMVDSVNVMGLAATEAAYTHGGPWKEALLRYLQANRDYLRAQLAQHLPGIVMHAPESTFLAWLDCSALQLQPSAQAFFLEHAKVAFNPGDEFGEDYGQWIRLNFGCPRAVLDEAITRLAGSLVRP